MTAARGGRIVYVEDDDDIREMMESFLDGEGYAVASFRTAEDGLDALARDGCDLLLTDYVLPGEDAAWLLREARGRGLLEGVPVIVVSAEYKPAGIGSAAFLRKPVKMNVLLDAIDRALRERATASTPDARGVAPAEIDLVLYVATPSHESERACRNLDRILDVLGRERFSVTVRDIGRADAETLRAIEDDRIVVVPTLVKRIPAPKLWIAGDLSKRDYVTDVLALALPPEARRRPG